MGVDWHTGIEAEREGTFGVPKASRAAATKSAEPRVEVRSMRQNLCELFIGIPLFVGPAPPWGWV